MENQIGYYAIIPANVRYDKNLPPNAKLLYGEITALCNQNGFCWATNKYFADLYIVSERTVTDWIKKLEDSQYISTEVLTKRYEDGTVKKIRNIYIVGSYHIEEKPQNHIEVQFNRIEKKLHNHIEENFAYNNTNNNNTIIKETYKEKFEIFYKNYPRKVGKANVEKWFDKNKPNDELFNTMIKKLELFKKTPDWTKQNGQFIPYPATWLNQKRWEDELQIETQNFVEDSGSYEIFETRDMTDDEYAEQLARYRQSKGSD